MPSHERVPEISKEREARPDRERSMMTTTREVKSSLRETEEPKGGATHTLIKKDYKPATSKQDESRRAATREVSQQKKDAVVSNDHDDEGEYGCEGADEFVP